MNVEATVTAQATADVRTATVVVPLDGTPQASAALPVARALAAIEGATLHIVHVSDEERASDGVMDALRARPGEGERAAVLDHRPGDPAAGIVAHARELGSRLIVMSPRCTPSTGRGALGTVTREVLRGAPCPVVLVPPALRLASWSLGHILLPHDGIPTTAAAIARAADLAAKARAELAVLHIASTTAPPPAEPGALITPRYLDQPQHEWPNWAREFMDRLVALGGLAPTVRMRLLFACGEPADVIVRFAAEHHTDLVVIAWVVGWEPEQRTTMRRVIDQAPAPLMIFPLEEPQRGMMF